MSNDRTTETPISGVLDIDDERAFVRVDGYLPSPRDVHVPTAQLRRYGLRRGDAVTGAS
ncbi:hypothetical protein JNW88_31050, partial [Micromonospora sp. ATA32]|nr:hypothetical protein [Micromonospora sp. ATA32]